MSNFKEKAFMTHEVGSLRKPKALLLASDNKKLSQAQLDEFEDFMTLIGYEIVPEDLLELLKSAGPTRKDDQDFHSQINRWRVHLNIKYKESTGIDLVDAGEWIRREMYQHLVDNDAITGVQLLSHVRSFDYNFYKPGIYNPPLEYDDSKQIHIQEFNWAKEVATKPLKVCVTAFNTAAEWSYHGKANFEDFMFDLVDELFVPETIKLLDADANWIQMDEPALTTHPEHVDVFVDAWNYWVDKIKPHTNSETVLSIHNCFSDYDLLWPILPELDELGAITLEFANRDTWELGVDPNHRKAYAEYLKPIQNLYQEEIGFQAKAALGVLPVHTDHETSPELIRDRLLYISEIIGDPKLVLGAPDCGLRQRTLPIAHNLLENLSVGAQLARKELGE